MLLIDVLQEQMLVLTVLTHACERALETRRLESRENAMDVLSSCHMLFQPHMMSNQRKLFGPFSRSAPLIKCLASQGRCCNAADAGQSFATAKADPPDSNAVSLSCCHRLLGHLVVSCSLQSITTKQHTQYLQPCRSRAALPLTGFLATYACSEGMCPCVLLHRERSSIHLAIIEIAT